MAVLRRPGLLANHMANYVELARAELAEIGRGVAVRAAAGIAAAVAAMLALGLTAVAIMLSVLYQAFSWGLVLVPAVAWLGAVIGILVAMRPAAGREFSDVREQLNADMIVLRMAKEKAT